MPNIKTVLNERVNNDEDKKLDQSNLPEGLIRRVKEDRQLKKMLQENLPSHWMKGPEKIKLYNKDGEVSSVESHEDWRTRQRLEKRMLKVYLAGDYIDHPQPTYIKERDGILKSNREVQLEKR